MQLARGGKPMPEYVPALVAARVLYLSKVQVLRYFASGDLKGFHVGPGRNAAVKIARSSIIEFAEKYQKRTITQAEIDQWLEE
jgi:soluble P-type ATPase